MLNRRGMTVVELLLVFTIIGLLAAIAMPRFQYAKDRAFVATMKQDLRTFAMHQESHYYDRATYTDDVNDLRAGGFDLSREVTISVNEATLLGWSATAEHAQSLVRCYVFVGGAAPLGVATVEGTMECS
jgi:prepilin-type N-terminal cleavage/methylation domain-containing protein